MPAGPRKGDRLPNRRVARITDHRTRNPLTVNKLRQFRGVGSVLVPIVFQLVFSAFYTMTTAIVLVDHGSRRAESNQQLERAASVFITRTDWQIVEPAHMELAEPSIATAVQKCIDAGANRIVVFPWFLAPGRHWHDDIPKLVHEAAAKHEGLEVLVTAPFGVDPLLAELADQRIRHCLEAATNGGECEICNDSKRCEL